MTDAFEILQKPKAKEIYMLAGWRQWADAGAVSSGLPQYLIEQTGAQQIGTMRPDGFYLFQIPGTHDLVRPVVKFEEGYPKTLQAQTNELFYTGDEQKGIIFFLGDEPHMDIERYAATFLNIARTLEVRRIVSFGGVYGELPYDKARLVSAIYSLPRLKEEVVRLAVNLSDYHGGASISSILCRRAGERGMEFEGFYALVPAYDFSTSELMGNSIRLENDYAAWLAVMQRVNHSLRLGLDLSDLEEKSHQLIELVDAKVEELDQSLPQLGVRDYLKRISEEFSEMTFNPLDDMWEDEIRRLLDKFDNDEPSE